MSGLLLRGAGGSGLVDVWTPASISGLIAWHDPDLPSTVWQDTGATTPAVVNDDVALVQDRTGNAYNLSQSTGANEPTLVAWDAEREALFIKDATDILPATNGFRAASNGVAGYSVALVVEMPPVLTTNRHIIQMTSSSGNSKFVLYVETNGKMYLNTRRVAADSVSGLGDPSTALVGGNRYVIIASVDYATGAGVIEVNGAITGQGISGTYGWTTGAACEALDPTALNILGSAAQPFTLGSGGEMLHFNKALSSTERALMLNHLNARWSVF